MCWKGMDKARSQACWHTRAHTRSTRAVMAVTAASQPKIALCICQAPEGKTRMGMGIDLAICRNPGCNQGARYFPTLRWTAQGGSFLRCSAGGGKISPAKGVVPRLCSERTGSKDFVFLGYSSICVREITYTVASSQRVIIIIASPTSPAHLFRRGHGRTQRPVAPSGVFLSRISNESASPSRP
ncbi:hypothetical protein BJV78DRAFT_380812 [Lactifluus subvellereus]|nr:hypothetical protein BJV78DRAFT_380812 [Lactifluus subvellereus]